MVKTVLLALVLALPLATVALAQEDTPTPEATITPPAEVEVNGLVYPLDSTQPVIVFVDASRVTNDGAFLDLLVFVKQEDGTYTALTACGADLGIACQPVTTRAVGPLAKVSQGSSLTLGGK